MMAGRKLKTWRPIVKLLDRTTTSAHVVVEGSARPVWVRKRDMRAASPGRGEVRL